MSTSENHRSPDVQAIAVSQEVKWSQDRVLLALMVVAAVLGLIYNGVILLSYGPDEPRHMNYVKLLLDEHRLPYITANGTEYASAHSLHPPLYYLLLVPFYALVRGLPGDFEWHLLRGVSLVLCLATLPLIYQIAQRAGGGDRGLARLVVAQVALLPIFGMTAGVINNDGAALLAVVLFLWLLAVKYPDERSLKSAIVLGVCFGLGGLCKATVLICDGIALIVYLWLQRETVPLRSSLFWKRLAVIVAGVLLFSGPWYGRNMALYGQFAGPIERGYSLVDMNWLPQGGPLVMMLHPNFPRLFGMVNWSIFYSMWSQKDWIPAVVRNPVYYLLAIYCFVALAGTAWHPARRKENFGKPASTHTGNRVAFWAPLSAFIINWLACVTIALFQHWGWHEGGRYLLPSLCGLSIFLALGWRGLLGSSRLNVLTMAWSTLLAGINILAIYWLLAYLNPTFGPKG